MNWMVWATALVGVTVVSVFAGCSIGGPPAQNETLMHGPFEIVAQGKRIAASGYPNSNKIFGSTEVTSFSVRWHGQLVDVPGTGSKFFTVLRLIDAPRPALLVGNTDYQLVYEDQGRLVIKAFGEGGGMAKVQWLDSVQGQPGDELLRILGKNAVGDETELRGGRWLRLANNTVLDVQTLTSYPVRPWIEPGQPHAGLRVSSVETAHAFSPGRTQYVTTADDYVREGSTERYTALVVVDIPTGKAYALPVDHRRMRYVDSRDMSPAWVEHYFQWQRDAQGAERLMPRLGARLSAWKGRYSDFKTNIEYRVEPVAPAMEAELKRFLVERLGAKEAPNSSDPARQDGRTLTLPGCDHVVAIGAHFGYGDNHVGIYIPAATEPPFVRCQDMVRRIGAAFDAELATGRFDKFFLSI